MGAVQRVAVNVNICSKENKLFAAETLYKTEKCVCTRGNNIYWTRSASIEVDLSTLCEASRGAMLEFPCNH